MILERHSRMIWICRFGLGLCFGSITGIAQDSVSDRVENLPGISSELTEVGDSLLPPLDFFRKLLEMPPLDREQALAGRPASKREALKAKIAEYSKMPAADRERRLRTTELRFYLMPLMKLSPGERSGKLEAVPPHLRKLVADRLQHWDLLPQPFQKEVLDQESAIHYFARLEAGTSAEREQILSTFPEDRRRVLEAEIQKWRRTPKAERQKMYARFDQFFELPPDEKEKTLNVLSEEERVQMQEALQRFGKLPAAQREAFIESFQKFANMSVEERDQFLNNAERWQAMSGRERQTWRNLINLLPVSSEPPLPPGFAGAPRIRGIPLGQPAQGVTNPLPPLPGNPK